MIWFSEGYRISCSCSFYLIYCIPLKSVIFVFHFPPMAEVGKKITRIGCNTLDVSCSRYGQDTGNAN